MPTYGYECAACGHTFDVFQNMSDEPLKVCPQCGGRPRRLINGGTGVIFKGSGFYVTDRRAKPPSASPKPAATGAAASAPTTAAPAAACPASSGCPASAAGSCPKAANE